MSHKTCNESLYNIQQSLSQLLDNEYTGTDRHEQRNLIATLYIRYMIIANRLSECVDQTVQAQKIILITNLLEAVIGRMLELKHDLVEADLNEWTHCGDVIEKLRLIPEYTELKIPICFRVERKEEIENCNRTIDEVLKKLGYVEKVVEKPKMTLQQAVLLVQVHERARQGRLRVRFIKELRNTRERPRIVATGAVMDPTKKIQLAMAAAIRIQKMWKGFVTRRRIRNLKMQERVLIGMVSKIESSNEHILRANEVKERRRELKMVRKKEYEKAVKKCRKELENNQKEIILEQLTDDARRWLREYKIRTGKLPEYTGETSRSIFRQMSSRQATDSEISKSTQISSKDGKTKKTKTQKLIKSKDSKSSEDTPSQQKRPITSNFVPIMRNIKDEYDEIWLNVDESSNPHQHVYTNIMVRQETFALEDRLRKVVDEIMATELQLLQEALDRDRGYKGKRTKSGKKVKRSAKKSKKKKEKDLTPDRTTESLLEELVANGIIKKFPSVYLNDYIGEKSSNDPVPYNKGKLPNPQLGDVRQLLSEYCILPMLSAKIHEITPHTKSLLIAGPAGSGKSMLVHAICTEIGAVLFDLTPANIVGKYPGKSGLTMLIHLVLKVARLLQPAIIFTSNAEKPFVKKISKADTSDPKRLKKDLPKIVKNFCPEDRIMLLGISDTPWEADQKLLQQVYQKLILIPKLDYSSRYLLWKNLLGKYPAINIQFDFTGLTRISDGYTAGSIISSVNDVLTVKRTLQLRIKPLSPLELINALSKKIPVYKEEESAFLNWWHKTPVYKMRAQEVEALKQAEAADQEIKQATSKRIK